jgi:hypothetical protein
MMTTQMTENLKKTSEQDWQPEDNAWVSEEKKELCKETLHLCRNW